MIRRQRPSKTRGKLDALVHVYLHGDIDIIVLSDLTLAFLTFISIVHRNRTYVYNPLMRLFMFTFTLRWESMNRDFLKKYLIPLIK